VHLGATTKEVGPGASVLIPPDTWISVDVVGNEPVSLIAIFSEPGFEEYMRAISVREGEPNGPMSKTELDSVRAQHPHAVNYKGADNHYCSRCGVCWHDLIGRRRR
jgi:hypothetical protein